MSYVAGFIMFVVGVMVFAVINAGFHSYGMMLLIDLPSVAGLLFINCAVIVATGTSRLFVDAIKHVVTGRGVLKNEDKEKATALFATLSRVTMLAALMFTVMSIMMLLVNLDDMNAIGPMLMIALLSLFYGAVINIIVHLPIIYILKHR